MRAATTGAEGTPRPEGAEATPPAAADTAATDTLADSASSPRQRGVTVVAPALFGVITLLWLVAARQNPALLERDWLAFDRAAGRVLEHGWASAYQRSAREQLPFLYPPYGLWFTLPLALLGSFSSYLAVIGSALAAMGVAAVALRRLLPERADAARAVMAVSLVSGPFLLVVITGQIAAGYVASILLGLVLRQRGRARAGGLCWALLAVKPNLAAPFVLYLALRRDRRSLEGFAGGVALLLCSTIPMGVGAWLGFRDGLRVVRTILGDLDNWYGQVTLLAGFRVTLEPLGAGWAAQPLWLAVVAPIGMLSASLWRTRNTALPASELGAGPSGAGSSGAGSSGAGSSGAGSSGAGSSGSAALRELRLVGTVCLFAVVANPRLYCYDALVLVVPAAAWYLGRDHYRRRGRRAIGLCVAGAYAATMGTFVGLRSAPLTALCCVAWLLFERAELRQAPLKVSKGRTAG